MLARLILLHTGQHISADHEWGRSILDKRHRENGPWQVVYSMLAMQMCDHTGTVPHPPMLLNTLNLTLSDSTRHSQIDISKWVQSLLIRINTSYRRIQTVRDEDKCPFKENSIWDVFTTEGVKGRVRTDGSGLPAKAIANSRFYNHHMGFDKDTHMAVVSASWLSLLCAAL
jgi:hypothetical protein